MDENRSSSNVPDTLVQTVTPAAGQVRGLLTLLAGEQIGRVMSLSVGVSVTLGRSQSATYRVEDASVSGTHARIVMSGAVYFLADLASTNGTFVNGVRVTESITLKDGDRIQLGANTLLRFALVSEAEERALRTMYESAHKDGLTGVYNRKHFDERLATELAFAVRHHSPLAVMLLDADHFKTVNDTYGHPAGDEVLRQLGALVVRGVRAEDVVARYGGEEFVVLARELTPPATALTVAERIRQAIQSLVVPYEGKVIRLTVSVGVVTLTCCGDKKDKDTLLALADQRLYRAKALGRNRSVGPDP